MLLTNLHSTCSGAAEALSAVDVSQHSNTGARKGEGHGNEHSQEGDGMTLSGAMGFLRQLNGTGSSENNAETIGLDGSAKHDCQDDKDQVENDVLQYDTEGEAKWILNTLVPMLMECSTVLTDIDDLGAQAFLGLWSGHRPFRFLSMDEQILFSHAYWSSLIACAREQLNKNNLPVAKLFILGAGLCQQSRVTAVEYIFKVCLEDKELDEDKLELELPFYHRVCEAVKSEDSMKAYLLEFDLDEVLSEMADAEQRISIIFVDEFNDAYKIVRVNPLIKLKTMVHEILATLCADDPGSQSGRKACTKSLRISFNEQRLFLSSCGKKTLSALGMKDGSEIMVEKLQPKIPTAAYDMNRFKKPNKPSKKRGNKKAKKKIKARQPDYASTTMEEDCRLEHSRLISRAFEEAESLFKEIRQRLNNLAIRNDSPKKKLSNQTRTHAKEVKALIAEPKMHGGKAGTTVFPILVGDTNGLYQSSKKKQQCNLPTSTIDLHGCTIDEATEKLEDALPEWVEAAMKGAHPFVIPVNILCGGGSQILAEAVEKWICRQAQVANRPGGLYST